MPIMYTIAPATFTMRPAWETDRQPMRAGDEALSCLALPVQTMMSLDYSWRSQKRCACARNENQWGAIHHLGLYAWDADFRYMCRVAEVTIDIDMRVDSKTNGHTKTKWSFRDYYKLHFFGQNDLKMHMSILSVQGHFRQSENKVKALLVYRADGVAEDDVTANKRHSSHVKVV